MPVQKKQKEPLQKSKGLSVSNAVKLGVDPIPFEYGGSTFSFVQGQRYSPFLAPSDDFAKTLLECKTLSTTHTACIETKKTYCAGQGLYDINKKEFSKDQLGWLKRMNVKGESQLQVLRKVFGSFFTFGNVPIEIVRLTVMGKKKLFIYVHSFLEWRLGWPDKNGNITEAIQSKLFMKTGMVSSEQLKDALVLPLYSPDQRDSKNWKQTAPNVERTMIWIKNDMDGYATYGMPSSVASLIYQVLEYKAARYNMDNFDNNMVIGGILALEGNLSQEEADKVGKSIIRAHTGDGKRGRVAVIASEEGISGSEYKPFTTQSEGSFIESDGKVMEKIILANEWSSLLAGLPQAGSMGKGNTFLRTEYSIKKKTVIDPAQEFIIASLWEPVFQIAGAWIDKSLVDFELGILDIDPVSALADIDPTNAVTVNEVREAINLPLDESAKGKMYMGEMAAPKKDPNEKDPKKKGGNEDV